MTPTLHTATHATSTIPRIPRHNDAVDVPSSTFIPCDSLQEELDQQDLLWVTDDFGYLVYRQVCRLVGHHLQQCNEAVSLNFHFLSYFQDSRFTVPIATIFMPTLPGLWWMGRN